MSNVASREQSAADKRPAGVQNINARAQALAERLEQERPRAGRSRQRAHRRRVADAAPGDGRKIGVIVHHVASMYPLEINLAQTLAGGEPISGVTWDNVHALNAAHARENDTVTRATALDLLRRRAAAAAAIRALSDAARPRRAGVAQRRRR
jgi:hypothetical protein